MKVYLVLYHDQYAHSECENECCCAETTEIKAVRLTRELAEKAIDETIERVSYSRSTFEIKEMDTGESET